VFFSHFFCLLLTPGSHAGSFLILLTGVCKYEIYINFQPTYQISSGILVIRYIHYIRLLAITAFTYSCLELELLQTQMAQKPLLRVEVGAHAVRNKSKYGGVVWAGTGVASRLCLC
jgi:hypothetical protein